MGKKEGKEHFEENLISLKWQRKPMRKYRKYLLIKTTWNDSIHKGKNRLIVGERAMFMMGQCILWEICFFFSNVRMMRYT